MPLFPHTLVRSFCLLGLLAAAPLVQPAEERLPVAVTQIAQENIVQAIRMSGSVTSPRSAQVSTAVGGLIEQFPVDAGTRVARGELLVKLDPELEQLALERALAAQTQAQSRLADARRRLEEAERLGSEQGIAITEVESRRSEVAVTEAELQAATAEARQQQAVVRRHEIRAPFTGVVSQRLAEIGEWVNPGDTLLELVATDSLRFDFQVPQNVYPRIDSETRVTLRLDAAPDKTFEGRILAVVPVKDPGARTFLLRAVAADDSNERLRATPGMSARGTLHIDTGRHGIVVPRDALLRYPDGRITVWVVDPTEGTAHERVVSTGLEFDGKVEITAGLESGLEVVTRGNESLQEGQAVHLQ